MISEKLKQAREYELTKEKNIKKEDRPCFHLTSRVGWMNDPNGFSYHDGKYHMFYQYHPYNAAWGPMHWGHAISEDLLHWEYKPVVLAPDEKYDSFGCFSGNAITMEDGKHLLMYTSVMKEKMEDGTEKEYQQQAIAIGDGEEYVKHEANPVISSDQIPEGLSKVDFRDPKVWLGKDGVYRSLIGGRGADGCGNLLLYKSKDCINWEFAKIFAKNDNVFGKMWECPDFFELDGKGVIIVSPQDMIADGKEYYNGNGTLCLIGKYNEETDEFVAEYDQSVDYGIDFYAPESICTSDGRRVMIGWMQNWDTCGGRDINEPYFGQMSLPREVNIVDGRLYQSPIKEIEAFRTDEVKYTDVEVNNTEIALDKVSGRCLDMTVEVMAADKEALYDRFVISMAKNDTYHTDFVFRPKEAAVEVNRECAGSRRAFAHHRKASVANKEGYLKARIIMDKHSIEIFLEDGREVMTTTIYTDVEADQITFQALGNVKMNVTKYTLSM